MKTTFEGVGSSRQGIRPVAVVAPLCRSDTPAGPPSAATAKDPLTVPSSAVLHKDTVLPLCLQASSSSSSTALIPQSTLQTNDDDVPFIVINSADRWRLDGATKYGNRRTSSHGVSSSGRGLNSEEKHRSSDLVLDQSSPFTQSSSQSVTLGVQLPSEWREIGDSVASCNFYYGALTNAEAKARLHPAPVGTFLLRDSSDPRFKYSLSVKTSRGTTSIRISGTSSGRFRLDSDPHQKSRMPSFASVLELVEHYYLSAADSRSSGDGKRHRHGHCILVESSGRSDTAMVLRRPLELSPAPLAHLCRRLINNLVTGEEKRLRLFDRMTDLDDKTKEDILRYLFKYPFPV